MTTLLYGSGLRLPECRRSGVTNVAFTRHHILARSGKGDKDRATMLPAGAPPRKLPAAGQEWAWQRVFPATRLYVHLETRQCRRHPLHETVLQQAVRRAVLAAGIPKRATYQTFRHSCATHLLEDGSDVRAVQELVGHKDVAATMICTRVLNRGPAGVRSPADRLLED